MLGFGRCVHILFRCDEWAMPAHAVKATAQHMLPSPVFSPQDSKDIST